MSPLSEEELDAMVERERGRDFTPLNEWETLAARARAEGLIRDRSVSFGRRPWMQVAAAVLIAVGGVAVGRYTSAGTSLQQPVAQVAPAGQTISDAVTPAVNASTSGAAGFTSADEAWAALNRAGEEYQKASAYLNAVQTARSDSSSVYQTRLAALNQVMRATESARASAPNDPVINQYYLATMGAQEATKQQLHTAQMIGPKPKGF
jgi:hypothetical protein